MLGTRRSSLPTFPPSEPRQSADEQARNRNHHSSDEYGQARKKQKVTREKTHTVASPLTSLCMVILTFLRFGPSFDTRLTNRHELFHASRKI